ncbi:hypothetical protein CHS0354_042459 [Potamilus streckersoni]|uniref:Succinate dehydrogenase cytochrome b560 subunit, mitochondrial n=1 Tax=Potamilus streckersoni TaxID=2493646 RepID=A0AAE0S977_9BIVA|nr:hypothetical protein CHS0354_042459 [Potamilus streckersoni]
MAALLRTLGRQSLVGKQLVMMNRCVPMATNTAYQEMAEFWAKNRKLKRPLSPHLRIFKPPLVMMLSLCHRTTGIAMALTISGVSITLLALPGDYATYLNMVKELHVGPLIIGTFKFLISFTASYHYLNGIRHLAYDWAKGFELKDSHASGYFVLALATLVSTGFVFFY